MTGRTVLSRYLQEATAWMERRVGSLPFAGVIQFRNTAVFDMNKEGSGLS